MMPSGASLLGCLKEEILVEIEGRNTEVEFSEVEISNAVNYLTIVHPALHLISNLEGNYVAFPIDLPPNEILFGGKSIGNV